MQKSTIIRKFLMALSGFFLIVFLLQHFIINFLSVIDNELFNSASHFMGTNPIIQFFLQPILLFGVLFHLIMGIVLELKNRSSRPIKYSMNKPSQNSTWMSRNMIITGIMIMLFLFLHFYDFWIPEVKIKFVDGDWTGIQDDKFRYWQELNHKFHDGWRVLIYCISFIFLSLHLLHGFQSALKTFGILENSKWKLLYKLSMIFWLIIPLLFILIIVSIQMNYIK